MSDIFRGWLIVMFSSFRQCLHCLLSQCQQQTALSSESTLWIAGLCLLIIPRVLLRRKSIFWCHVKRKQFIKSPQDVGYNPALYSSLKGHLIFTNGQFYWMFQVFLAVKWNADKHFCALFPVSLQARTHQAPSSCHHISALPPEPGRDTDKLEALYTKGTFIEPPISHLSLSCLFLCLN